MVNEQKNRNLSLTIFFILCLANISPFIIYRYVPTMDYPSHLFKASVIRNIKNADLKHFENFQINRIPAANILNDYLTAASAVFMPIDYAGRLTVGFGIILLPLAVLFWLNHVSPGNEPWAVLVCTMTWSQFFFWGNENFCLATSLLFFYWGLLATCNGQFRSSRVLWLTFLATLIYLAHFLVFLLAGLALLIHILIINPRSVRIWLMHFMTIMPGVALACIWFLSGGIEAHSIINWEYSWKYKLQSIGAGILPGPWNVKSLGWWSVFSIAFMGMVFYRAIRAWKMGRHFASALIMTCIVIAIPLTRWFIIFLPDQRIWWIIAMASFALLPKPRGKPLFALLIIGTVFSISTNIAATQIFKQTDLQIEKVEKVFSNFPRNLRLAYLGDPNLPRQLHRCFDYYHLRAVWDRITSWVGNDR
jgi:hypothetical protein